MKRSKGELLFLSGNLLSNHSADIVYLMEMCNAFCKAGYETTLCVPTPQKTREELFAYYSVEHPFELFGINLPSPLLNGRLPGRALLHSIIAAKKFMRRKGVFMYTREPWFFFLLSGVCKQPCIFEAHQYRFGRFRSSIYHHLVRYAMRSGRGRVVCISKSLMKQWQEVGIEPVKMAVAHDAVNLSKFGAAVPKEEARRRLSLPGTEPIVCYTGSLIPGKGVETLVRSSKRLTNVLFVIVGGAQSDVTRIRQRCNRANVLFIGQVPPNEVPIYQAAADVLALPNDKGSDIDDVTSPMKLFEYIAAKRPIVASNMPSLLEILIHNQNALISPAGDDDLLANNIALLLQDHALADRLVENASTDLQRYTWDARIDFLSTLLDESMYLQ